MHRDAGYEPISEHIQRLTLREAADLLDGSAMLREAFGPEVVEHYVHAARWEVAEADRAVTDHDLMRGFERF